MMNPPPLGYELSGDPSNVHTDVRAAPAYVSMTIFLCRQQPLDDG
jgi:hypothetical protein